MDKKVKINGDQPLGGLLNENPAGITRTIVPVLSGAHVETSVHCTTQLTVELCIHLCSALQDMTAM